MGLSMVSMLYLQEMGLLTQEKNKVLDIGPQNVYYATKSEINQLIERQGGSKLSADEIDAEVERLVYFSSPRPGERTTFFSEIASLTDIDYRAIDVAPAPQTDMVDLNFDCLPEKLAGYFDIVLNFGTTEHIFNQWNCFQAIHDALKVGGVCYCIVPMSGYLDHGFFCYTPAFFKELIAANHYELVDSFIVMAGINSVIEFKLNVRDDFLKPYQTEIEPYKNIPCFNIHAIFKKKTEAPFKVGLDVATTHSPVSKQISERYQNAGHCNKAADDVQSDVVSDMSLGNMETQLADLVRQRNELARELSSLRASTSWKLTAPLRQAVQWLRQTCNG